VVIRPRISSGYSSGQLGSENWEADVLPLNYTRTQLRIETMNISPDSQPDVIKRPATNTTAGIESVEELTRLPPTDWRVFR